MSTGPSFYYDGFVSYDFPKIQFCLMQISEWVNEHSIGLKTGFTISIYFEFHYHLLFTSWTSGRNKRGNGDSSRDSQNQ